MAQEGALVSDKPHSQPTSSSLDPSLSRNLSSSKLNAQAPEFVPTRSPTVRTDPPSQHHHQQKQQKSRLVFAPPSSCHTSVHPLIQNHHHNRIQHHQYPPEIHSHGQDQYYGSGNVQHEIEVSMKKENRAIKSRGEHNYGGASKKRGSDETSQKIINQVEYYFSDLNLATTDLLMRFISQNLEGYVPIHVVASFRKISELINSNSQLAAVLRNSSKLVVSEDGKKVRRKNSFTETDMEALQSRVVIAENLPDDHSHQTLMKIFSSVGSVKTIRTCQPLAVDGTSSASRSAKADGMLHNNKVHAFVEYQSVDLAEKAVTELNDVGNWRSGLRVRLMLKHTIKSGQARGKKEHDEEGNSEEENMLTSELRRNEKQAEAVHSYDHTGEEVIHEKTAGKNKGRNHGHVHGKGRGRGQYQQNNTNRGHQVSSNPNNIVAVVNEQKQAPPGPRMPDGTRGFTMGRGKPVAISL